MAELSDKKYKGAVFFDIDGTLVDERAGIYKPTEKTKEAIAILKDRGYLTGIATGRSRCYVPPLDVDFDCYICCNGANVDVAGQVIFNATIDPKDRDFVMQYLNTIDAGYDLETREHCYYRTRRSDLLTRTANIFNISLEVFSPLKEGMEIEPNKMMVLFDEEEQFAMIKDALGDRLDVARHHRNNSADVSRRDISKAVGIKAVIERFGLDIKDTYAFGDDTNDIDMLSSAGCGIAMTPHAKELDSVAKIFTKSVAEEGIYCALKDLGLI